MQLVLNNVLGQATAAFNKATLVYTDITKLVNRNKGSSSSGTKK